MSLRLVVSSLLLLSLIVNLASTGQEEEETPLKEIHAPGFRRAMTDRELQPLYRANLQDDLAYWRTWLRQRPRSKQRFTPLDVLAQLKKMLPNRYVALFIVQRGQIEYFRGKGFYTFAVKRMDHMRKELLKLHEDGYRIPDSVFLFNSEDESICHRLKPDGSCSVPVFTMIKRWWPSTPLPPTNATSLAAPALTAASANSSSSSSSSNSSSSSSGGRQAAWGFGRPPPDQEVLLPNFIHSNKYNSYYLPWDKKKNAALHRASLQRGMNVNSTRYQLASLSARDNETAQVLDVGLVEVTSHTDLNISHLVRSYIPMSQHARWRFLITTDGHTASSRFGHLLGINSVAIKERSPWVEFYYRSVRVGETHLEFSTADELLRVLQVLRQPGRSQELQAMATTAQQFAYRYLHGRAMALYARQAIIQYNKLFDGMHEVRRLQLPARDHATKSMSRRELRRAILSLERQLGKYSSKERAAAKGRQSGGAWGPDGPRPQPRKRSKDEQEWDYVNPTPLGR